MEQRVYEKTYAILVMQSWAWVWYLRNNKDKNKILSLQQVSEVLHNNHKRQKPKDIDHKNTYYRGACINIKNEYMENYIEVVQMQVKFQKKEKRKRKKISRKAKSTP